MRFVTGPHPNSENSNPLPASSALSGSLRRVLKESKRAGNKLGSKPIHDLRVALRRSRSFAEGFSEFDPSVEWRRMEKACRRFQHGLAHLRDVQVMSGWARNFRFDTGPSGAPLVDLLEREERHARHQARAVLENSPRKRWKQWKEQLPVRAEALPFGEPHFAAMALRRLKDVREKERQLRRSRSRVAYHKLRIALKRYRYTLESFLPEQHNSWEPALKRLQRLLGEIHDLDVLRAAVQRIPKQSLPQLQQKKWLDRLERERAMRVKGYEKEILRASRKRRPTAPPAFVWDAWEKKLKALAVINLPDAAMLLTSAAKPESRGPAKASVSPDKPRRPS